MEFSWAVAARRGERIADGLQDFGEVAEDAEDDAADVCTKLLTLPVTEVKGEPVIAQRTL